MSTNSFLPAHPHAVEAAQLFKQACEFVLSDQTPLADAIIRRIDSDVLVAHYYAVSNEWTPRNEAGTLPIPQSVTSRVKERMPGVVAEREVYHRDGWTCRWCDTPVIYKRANKRMNLIFPVMFGNGPRNVDFHGLIMSSQASLDHVIPHSRGGTNDPENLVTACWPCQFARGNDDFERLGLNDPRSRPPIVTDWDGCHTFT